MVELRLPPLLLLVVFGAWGRIPSTLPIPSAFWLRSLFPGLFWLRRVRCSPTARRQRLLHQWFQAWTLVPVGDRLVDLPH